MVTKIPTEETAGITEFKKSPISVLAQAENEEITILQNNKPAFCCLSVDKYKELLDFKKELDQAKLLLLQERYETAKTENKAGDLPDAFEFLEKLKAGDLER